MLLLLGLRGELQVDVVGELSKVAETLLATANAISRETYETKTGQTSREDLLSFIGSL